MASNNERDKVRNGRRAKKIRREKEKTKAINGKNGNNK